jgi:hypothetical protein
VVVTRPESVRIGEGQLRGKVKGSTFLGSYVEYELELGDRQANMLAVDGEWMTHGIHSPGEDIAWTLAPERAYALPAGAEHETPAQD